jgi:hypothetical protein
LLPEALRFVGIPSSIAANTRQIIYGGILVFMMWKIGNKYTHRLGKAFIDRRSYVFVGKSATELSG